MNIKSVIIVFFAVGAATARPNDGVEEEKKKAMRIIQECFQENELTWEQAKKDYETENFDFCKDKNHRKLADCWMIKYNYMDEKGVIQESNIRSITDESQDDKVEECFEIARNQVLGHRSCALVKAFRDRGIKGKDHKKN